MSEHVSEFMSEKCQDAHVTDFLSECCNCSEIARSTVISKLALSRNAKPTAIMRVCLKAGHPKIE